MNVPAVLSIFKAIWSPHICLPHHTIPHLSQLPIPVSKAFSNYELGSNGQKGKGADIRAIVLDKDNCFAVPNTNTVDPSCEKTISELIETYSANNLLIVSNSSGLRTKDPAGSGAAALTDATGIPVLIHHAPKPSSDCGNEILNHFRSRGVDVQAENICVIGDRLFTDTVMANGMGSWSIWVKEGVRKDAGFVTKAEFRVERFLRSRGLTPRTPGLR